MYHRSVSLFQIKILTPPAVNPPEMQETIIEFDTKYYYLKKKESKQSKHKNMHAYQSS